VNRETTVMLKLYSRGSVILLALWLKGEQD